MRPPAIALVTLALLASAARSRGEEPPKPPSPRVEDVFSEAEGERTVVYIVPEGARVTKGQVVCVLDAIPGPREGGDRTISVRRAEAAYDQARLTREVAELAVTEYEQGTFRRSLEVVQGDLALAEADAKRAEDRLDWSRKMHEKKYLSEATLKAERLSLEKARFAVEQARTSKDVLVKYTKEKTLKELRAEVEKSRADELSRRATLDVERSRAAKHEAPMRPRVVLAPVDGTVALARPTRLVAVGAEVCKDQLLLRVVPTGR